MVIISYDLRKEMPKKDEKIYEEYELNFNLSSNSRQELMKKTVETFISEKPGYWKDGKKHATRYKYFVENLSDGRRVYLKRPTFLNKGIDFQVWVEKMDGDNDKRPSHQDVFKDLAIKKDENPNDFPFLRQSIEDVWNCQEPDEVIKKRKMNFKEGFGVELLLKILKWLFIEQDITYWNYDGRGMLKLTIEERAKL